MRPTRILLVLVAICSALSLGADVSSDLVLSSPEKILIGGGRFTMGLDDEGLADSLSLCGRARSDETCTPQAFASERPAHEVYVSAYAIDRTEVSRQAYDLCRAALRCPPPRVADHDKRFSDPSFPITGVTVAEAADYCAFVGGRLPTEAEWEKAARAGSARRFPWGRYFNSRVVNHGRADGTAEPLDGYTFTAPVDAFPDGKSAYGLLNMAGNAWEFTADYFDEAYYRTSPESDPRGPETGTSHVLRGGSFLSAPHDLRVTARAFLPDGDARADVGFRCAYDVRNSSAR